MSINRFGMLQYVLLVATVIVILVFFQTQALDVEQHNRRVNLLLQLKQVEGELDRDVLRVTSFLLVQYDPLVTAVHRLRGFSRQIQAAELILPGHAGLRFRSGLRAYLAAQERKLDILERIKSKAALVRNGLHYLPLVAEELSLRDPRFSQQVALVLNELLRYNLLGSALGEHQIADDIEDLALFAEVREPAKPAFHNVLSHMRGNLRLMGELARLRDAYMEVPSMQRFDELYAAYTDVYARHMQRSQTFSLILLLTTVALFTILGFALKNVFLARRQAERSWNQLRDAVESLSESFALFAPDGRLVLHNRRYLEFHPWLEKRLTKGVNLSQIVRFNQEADVFLGAVSEQGNSLSQPFQPRFPCRTTQTYVEQLRGGRWHLASDSRTSAGELVCVRVDISESKRREQELRKLYRALEQSPVSVVITDIEGAIEYVNPKFEEATGYSAAEVMGENPRVLKSGDKTPDEYQDLWQAITAGKVWRGEFHNKRKDGEIFWEAASISPVRNDQGEITHFIAVKEDITKRKQAEEQLRLSAAVFETTTEGIIVADAEMRIKAVNPAFTRITGYPPAEAIGRKPNMLSSGRHDKAFYLAMWRSLNENGNWSGEVWNRRKNGSLYPEWLSLAAIIDDAGVVREYVAVFSDITRRKQDEEQIRRQANYDALTALPNRSLLMDRLARSIAAARREAWMVALLFIDLDRFKEVNDTLGHTIGDELLQGVAERLSGCVREADTVARFGGDEFVIILEDIKQANDAADVAKKVIADLGVAFVLAGREVFIGASIGITLYPADTGDASSMLRHADMAMYRAKSAGRNNYQFFTLVMNEQVQRRMGLEFDLRQAMQGHQLDLCYQPIVQLDTGRLVGVEALLRWHHPQRGMIAPDDFIPLAEETGLIGPIGHWVLEAACAQAAAWYKAGLRLRMNVNLSSRQLSLGLLSGQLASILEESGLPAALLSLEITEGMMLEEAGEPLGWLQAMKALGVGLAVDDFGTGYSSLSYLKRFPMDTLKIDRSFVQGLPGDRENASLVRAIVVMAHSLGLQVVAEGVEDEVQQRFLLSLGCELAQGYLFSRPVVADNIPRLAQNRSLELA